MHCIAVASPVIQNIENDATIKAQPINFAAVNILMGSPKEPIIYSQQQIETMRNALISGFHRGRRLYGESFNMMYFAAWIESRFEERADIELLQFPEEYHDITEVHLTTSPTSGGRTDAFGRFLRGQSKRMSNIRMIACELYLTDPDCEFSSLTRGDIYEDKAQLAAPIYLAKFLNPNGIENNPMKADLMYSCYDSVLPDKEYQLSFDVSSEPCILSATLKQEHYETLGTTSVKESVRTSEYMGWAITTEEENLILAVKDPVRNSVILYNTIAVETNFYQDLRVGSFILLPFLNPIQILDSDKGGMDNLIAEHKNSVPDNALIFINKEEVA